MEKQFLNSEANKNSVENPCQDICYDKIRDVAVEIFVWTIIGVGLFDFIVQSVVLLTVFILSLFEPFKTTRKMFAVIIIFVFILIRVSLLGTVLRPFIQDWFLLLPQFFERTYAYSATALILSVFNLGIILGLIYIIKYGVSAKKFEDSKELKIPIPEQDLPTIVILMPIYNEVPEALLKAIDSMFAADYPSQKKHFFLSFDELEETELYFHLLKKLGILSKFTYNEILRNTTASSDKPFFPDRIDLTLENTRITVSRFPHGGKNSTQGRAFRIVQELYSKQSSNTFVLCIDSDIMLQVNALHNFVQYAQRNPQLIAATGLLTVNSQNSYNLFQYMQNAEYVESQLFVRAGEAGLGAVTCMPGAMAIFKMDSLQDVSENCFYNTEDKTGSSFGYHMRVLGEDRYLTYNLIKSGNQPYQVCFVPSAQCKTNAPDTFSCLLKQRRRWCLGTMACEVYLMTSPKMWSRFPVMIIYKMFMYESRSLDWFSWVALLSLFYNYESVSEDWGLLLFPMTVMIKYVILVFFCICSNRFKIPVFYIILVIFMPVFTIIVAIYSSLTWNIRSWGGPRTDGQKNEVSKILILTNVMESRNFESIVI